MEKRLSLLHRCKERRRLTWRRGCAVSGPDRYSAQRARNALRARLDLLRRDILALPALALSPVAQVVRPADREFPDAQSEHRVGAEARRLVHAGVRLRRAL